MLHLSLSGLSDTEGWRGAGVALPAFDIEQAAVRTAASPAWIHFGPGQIFRAFVANCQQRLLDAGKTETGIIAVVPHDSESLENLYKPHDNLTLLVQMKANGELHKKVIASITEVLSADSKRERDARRLIKIFEQRSLQIASFTITEKGYSLKGPNGQFLDRVKTDLEGGPEQPGHLLSKAASLAYRRYRKGQYPLAFVSLDNCSRNGDLLKKSLVTIAREWAVRGLVEPGFPDYLEDESKVSFPLTMIDKITPRPSGQIQKKLEDLGIGEMNLIVNAKQAVNAPFVNAETSEYLVIEDRFAAGRPPLEEAGVLFTDRDTVIKAETMKVTTCLNPLHTALAVSGCLLGYTLIADEMQDATLRKFAETIGYAEGLPVVTPPGIIDPKAFLDDVLYERLTNPFIPDTPQRIAADTSQKVRIRFGETIKAYARRNDLDPSSLTAIPLALAAWCRYLTGINDQGEPFALSPDPLLDSLQSILGHIELGSKPVSIRAILEQEEIFGVPLYEVGLGDKIEGMFYEMMAGPGAVRLTLDKYLL